MARKKVERNIYYDDIREKYYVNLDFGKDENGKQVKKTKTSVSIKEARLYLAEHESNKAKGNLVSPKKTTLIEWIDYYYSNILINSCEETTLYGYRNIINHIRKSKISDFELQKLKALDFQQYYTSLKECGLGNNTIRKHHNFLYTSLRIANKQDVIINNPMDKVEIPKKTQINISYYNKEEATKLLNIIKDSSLELPVNMLIFLALRRSELLGLKWENIDFENKVVSIKTARVVVDGKSFEKNTKTEKSTRTLMLTDDLEKLLIKEKQRQKEAKEFYGDLYNENGFIIVTDDGTPFKPNYLSKKFSVMIERNKLKKITLHGLRHTFATLANSMGVPLYNISRALGHSTVETTSRIYTHLLDEKHTEAINKVSELINSKID